MNYPEFPNGWIPVTERLPDSANEMVLVTYVWEGKSRVCAACYDSDDRYWNAGEWSIGDVVAWQPLPAAWVAPASVDDLPVSYVGTRGGQDAFDLPEGGEP